MTRPTASPGRSTACWRRRRGGIIAAAAPSRSLRSACPWPIKRTAAGLALFLRVAPDICRLRRGRVDRPLRQGETRGDIAEHHAHARPDAEAAHLIGRRELPVGGGGLP